MCDEVAIMNRGKILRQGTVAEIRAMVKSTPRRRRVRVATAPLGSAQAEIEKRFGKLRIDANQFELQLFDEEVTEIIDLLRQNKIAINAVESEGGSLEAAFIDIITAGDEQSKGNAK